MDKDPQHAWEFLEDVANKSMQWETMGGTEEHAPTREGIYPSPTRSELEEKVSYLMRRVETLELQPTSRNVHQVSSIPLCIQRYHAPTKITRIQLGMT